MPGNSSLALHSQQHTTEQRKLDLLGVDAVWAQTLWWWPLCWCRWWWYGGGGGGGELFELRHDLPDDHRQGAQSPPSHSAGSVSTQMVQQLLLKCLELRHVRMLIAKESRESKNC